MTAVVCIVLDVGIHMHGVIHQGIECLKSLIQRKFFAGKKEKMALVLCGTATSDGSFVSGVEKVPHISVVRELSEIDWDLLEFLNPGALLSSVQADVLDALIIGVNHLLDHSKAIRRVSEKRILLVSNLEGPGSHSKLARFIDEVRTTNIQFSLLGRSFRENVSPSFRPQSSPQPDHSSTSIIIDPSGVHKSAFKTVHELWHQVNGESYTFTEALPLLTHFETGTVVQRGWKVELRIGESLSLPVEGYIRVKEARPPCLKFVYAADPSTPICTSTSYLTQDDHPTQLDSSQVIRGYRYGDTLVSFANADISAVKLPSEKCLSVIGFTSACNVPRNLYVGDAVTVFVSEDSTEAGSVTEGLSALTKALIELDEVALVRKVYSRNSPPRLGVLTPEIHDNQATLVYTDLGFSEDFRTFQFAELPITTQSDAVSSSQLDAMESFVDSMLLETDKGQTEEDGVSSNYRINVEPEELLNPWVQHLFSWFRARGLMTSQHEPAVDTQNFEIRWLNLRAFPGLEPLHSRLNPDVVDTNLQKSREYLINSLPTLVVTKTETPVEPIASVVIRHRLMLSQLFGLSSDASDPQMLVDVKSESYPDTNMKIDRTDNVGSPYPNLCKVNHGEENSNSVINEEQLRSATDPLDLPGAELHNTVTSRLDFRKQLNVEDLMYDLE